MDIQAILQGLLGIAVFVAIAWAVSEDRRQVEWRIMAIGLAVQVLLAVLLLFLPPVKAFFAALAAGVRALQAATLEGTAFVFGYLGGGELPFDATGPGSTFIFGIQSLPVILMVGALSALLWHWRVLIYVVRGAAWLVERTFRVGGAVGVSSAANIFMGMVEAPLLVKPYIPKLTRSELFAVMAGGLSTIAGSTMVVVGTLIDGAIPNAFSHLLIASVINAPAAIALAKVMVPGAATAGEDLVLKSDYRSSLDAITRGTTDAVRLLANVVGMLIVFVSLIALVNIALAALWPGGGLTLQGILGHLMAPIAWLMGIPWADAQTAGGLLGTKVVVNELIAYVHLTELPEGALSARASFIMTYALCSFSNFGSLAIMIGGLTAMAPERTSEIVSLGLKAILAGFLAAALTATIVGMMAAP